MKSSTVGGPQVFDEYRGRHIKSQFSFDVVPSKRRCFKERIEQRSVCGFAESICVFVAGDCWDGARRLEVKRSEVNKAT